MNDDDRQRIRFAVDKGSHESAKIIVLMNIEERLAELVAMLKQIQVKVEL